MDPNQEVSVSAPALPKPDFLSRLFAPNPATATPSFPHLRIFTPPALAPVICNLPFKMHSEASLPTTSSQPQQWASQAPASQLLKSLRTPHRDLEGPCSQTPFAPRASSQLAFRAIAVLPPGAALPLPFPLFPVVPTWISSRSHLGSGCHSGVISLPSNFLGTLFKHLPHYLPVLGFSEGTDLIESVLPAHACPLACVRASNSGCSL